MSQSHAAAAGGRPARLRARPHALALALHLALAGALLALPLQAAAQAAEAATPRQTYAIPAGPLGDVLAQFAATAGVRLAFDPALVAGKQSGGLQGSHTVSDGFARILAGSGFELAELGGGAYSLRKAPPPPAPEATLPAVTVTGEKFERPLEETLSSVAVTTSQDFAEHGDQTVTDVMMRTPGVYTQSGNENWGIRGVPVSGFDEQGAGTMNGAVTVFVDGAAQPHRLVTLSPLNLWDAEQLEVFRGAQSTTQGRNSLAGAVVLKTKDPTFRPEFAVQANAGRFGERGASALANGTLVDGTVAARLAVDYQTGDGYIRNETLGEDANRQRAMNARGKLLIQPTDRLNILLTLARTEHRSGSQAVAVVDGKPRYFSLFLNTEEEHELDQDTGVAKIDYFLSDAWTLTSLTTGTWAEYRSVLDFDQGTAREREAIRKHRQRLASQELRLSYEAEALTGFVGVYYGRHTNDIDDRLNLRISGVEDPALIANGDVRIRNTAVFGEANWEFVDRWQLIGGLRYDREKNETAFDYVDPLGFATVQNIEADTSFEELLPKIGLSHELSDDHLIGVLWKRGYRGGGIDLSTNTAHSPYDPEYTSTWELSWRGSWLDERLRTSANLFHTDWKDQQVEVSDENGIATVANAARARMRGLELGADYRATPALQLFLGASYIDAKYREFMFDGQDLSGQKFPFAPKYKLAVGGSYTFGNGLQVGADIVHQSDSVTLATNDDGLVVERPNDRVTLVNFSATYRMGKAFSLSGYVKNLFDERYIVNNQGGDTLDAGAPRTLGVAVRYDF